MRQKTPPGRGPCVLIVLLVSGALWSVLTGVPARAEDGADFKVIVNASNPTGAMARKQLGKIFLKKVEEWPNGFAITVVDQRPDAAVREAFSQSVLQKDPTAIEAYWSRLIFSGMGVPPIKLASDAEVIAFVGQNVGSIGYVSGGAELKGPVKELEVGP